MKNEKKIVGSSSINEKCWKFKHVVCTKPCRGALTATIMLFISTAKPWRERETVKERKRRKIRLKWE